MCNILTKLISDVLVYLVILSVKLIVWVAGKGFEVASLSRN